VAWTRRANVTSPERFALKLDQLMTDPKLRGLRDALLEQRSADPPSAFGDQLASAVDEANRVADAWAAAGIYDRKRGEWLGTPEWVRLGALTALTTWWAGDGRTCMHSPCKSRPEPVFAAAWKPGLVTCMRCVHLFKVAENSVPDRTCDGCGRVVAGVSRGEPIYPSALKIAALMWQFGVCEDCRFWTPSS
jgi:hypothetical protein